MEEFDEMVFSLMPPAIAAVERLRVKWQRYLENLRTDWSWYSDINWVIMDYLVSEGYPGAAEKFAQETNICNPADMGDIRDRVRIRKAIHDGKADKAVEMINELDPEVCHIPPSTLSVMMIFSFMHHAYPSFRALMIHNYTSVLSLTATLTTSILLPSASGSSLTHRPQILDTDHLLHFNLLQLQLIEIIRGILDKPGAIQSSEFRPALQFATEQLAPRAPTDQKYQQALERTMALMIFPPEKMTPEFKELLDLKLRETVANSVNKAILESRGQRSEAKIRQLVRARAWAEDQANEAKIELPNHIAVGLDAPGRSSMAGVEATAVP